jgi:hypothetical protein
LLLGAAPSSSQEGAGFCRHHRPGDNNPHPVLLSEAKGLKYPLLKPIFLELWVDSAGKIFPLLIGSAAVKKEPHLAFANMKAVVLI